MLNFNKVAFVSDEFHEHTLKKYVSAEWIIPDEDSIAMYDLQINELLTQDSYLLFPQT